MLHICHKNQSNCMNLTMKVGWLSKSCGLHIIVSGQNKDFLQEYIALVVARLNLILCNYDSD